MERIQKILNHPLYQEQFHLLQEAEKERIFCRHTMEHFVDVARLMYIYTLEEHTNVNKELIYAAALLHDIGRYEQISLGTPHHISGARMADEILTSCDFSKEEVIEIAEAIAGHRNMTSEEDSLLARYLYRADKQSRNCFACPAKKECNWPDTKKNLTLSY